MMDAFRLPLEAGLVGVTVAADAGAAPLAALNLAGLALALLFGYRALRLLRPAAVAALVSSRLFCRAIVRHKAPPMSRFARDLVIAVRNGRGEADAPSLLSARTSLLTVVAIEK